MKIREKYNLKFLNIHGRKQVSFDHNELLGRYLYIYNHEDYVDEFLEQINLAQNGQLQNSEFFLYGSNPPVIDYSADDGGAYFNALISDTSLVLFEEEIINDSITIPLEDLKEILLSWKEFL